MEIWRIYLETLRKTIAIIKKIKNIFSKNRGIIYKYYLILVHVSYDMSISLSFLFKLHFFSYKLLKVTSNDQYFYLFSLLFFFLLLEEFGREKCIIVHIRNHLDSTNQDFNGIKLE